MRLILPALLGTLVAVPALAACPPADRAVVTVEKQQAPVRYDFTRSLSEMATIAGRDQSAAVTQHHAVGLTAADLFVDMGSEVMMHDAGNGQFCAAPTRVTVRLGFRDLTVYVARELPKRSCPYREVLAHEERHVTTDRALLPGMVRMVEQRLRTVLRGMNVVTGPTPAVAEMRLRQILSSELEKVMTELAHDRERAQARIDSPFEYERVASSCSGQLRAIIAQHVNAEPWRLRRPGRE